MRSYQGPAPTRSIALTVVVLRNARQPLAPEPGNEVSAIVVQILSAPARPVLSPKRRSPPKPSCLPETRRMAAKLVTKKLNFVPVLVPPPLLTAPPVPDLPPLVVLVPPELLPPLLVPPPVDELVPPEFAPALLAPPLVAAEPPVALPPVALPPVELPPVAPPVVEAPPLDAPPALLAPPMLVAPPLAGEELPPLEFAPPLVAPVPPEPELFGVPLSEPQATTRVPNKAATEVADARVA
jgi:hypothetical protein